MSRLGSQIVEKLPNEFGTIARTIQGFPEPEGRYQPVFRSYYSKPKPLGSLEPKGKAACELPSMFRAAGQCQGSTHGSMRGLHCGPSKGLI